MVTVRRHAGETVGAARADFRARRGGGVVGIDFDALGPRIAELCRRYGVAELAVFGSVARGEDGPDSDVDLLYVSSPDNDLGWEFYRLADDLAALLGRKVDIVPKENLHWVMRDRVLADARVLYAA